MLPQTVRRPQVIVSVPVGLNGESDVYFDPPSTRFDRIPEHQHVWYDWEGPIERCDVCGLVREKECQTPMT